MIHLSQIDYRRLLDGARVPLVRVTPDPLPEWAEKLSETLKAKLLAERYEWRLDRSWLFEGDEARGCDADPEWTALDPKDPEVARWCDRKIAETLFQEVILEARLFARQNSMSGSYELVCAAITDGSSVRAHNGTHGRAYNRVISHHVAIFDLLRPIVSLTEQIHDARAALIRHYYPPKATT